MERRRQPELGRRQVPRQIGIVRVCDSLRNATHPRQLRVVRHDDLPVGRPSPMMMYRCFLDLQVWPASAVVKVDDTVPGILEGRAAGSWTVALALSGNAAGIAVEDLADPDAPHVEEARARAQEMLRAAEPDYIIDTVADLLPVIEEIEQRMA